MNNKNIGKETVKYNKNQKQKKYWYFWYTKKIWWKWSKNIKNMKKYLRRATKNYKLSDNNNSPFKKPEKIYDKDFNEYKTVVKYYMFIKLKN